MNSPVPEPRVAVLMTCHNRRDLTLTSLALLAGQWGFREQDLYLVDDGSSDGTGEAVRAVYPRANVIEGDGSLFWNGGMNRAWQEAVRADTRYDYYFWLNDDVELAADALAEMVVTARGAARDDGAVICVGATMDPDRPGEISYGGHLRPAPARRPLRMRLVAPTGEPCRVDTISGNAVLVSSPAHQILGELDLRFEHIYGDLDYGLRAGKKAIPMVLAPRVVGSCGVNSVSGSSLDPDLSRTQRLERQWREAGKVHGRDWRRFVARHGGGFFQRLGHRMAPYLRIILDRPNRHGGSVGAQ